MQVDGLVTRVEDRPGAPYQLSEFGSSLSSVHRALFDWSRAHVRLGQAAGAERIEDALRRLHLRHSTAVLQVLDAGGPMRFVHIANEVGLEAMPVTLACLSRWLWCGEGGAGQAVCR